jgi:4a-hydroxytetrahydrobiopterin dehydratase
MVWEINNEGFLTKEFEFEDFVSAIEFIVKVAELAETMNHHPDLKIHSYKKVTVFTKTHSEKSITEKDYNISKAIDGLD